MYYYFFGTIGVILLVWVAGSYAVVWSIEEPAYTVGEQKNGYEIRNYRPYIIAETIVSGNYDSATNKGFQIIADYIFGNNIKKESISMTTPVLESGAGGTSEQIAMTIPVVETVLGNTSRRIAFVLPSKYTLDTLPLPNNPAVKFTEVPARRVAVLRFTWYPTSARVERKKELLKNFLVRDKQEIVGEVETARYNPPLSMPLLLRSEILIPIK
jgi:hypothetical protein